MTDSPADIVGVVLRVVVALVFVGMGVNHFRPGPARVMAKLIPPRLRFDGIANPLALVYLTGVCEIAGGVGILIPELRGAAAVGLVLFLIAVFPANAYAAEHPERFGSLAIPFWPRFAGQLVLILVVVLAAIL
ncbi:DoxX family protein [Marisediminicola sp. LYQ134]|uniref:DoxX family protein n=1 Tax=unclassified Marisediminicola TaxID=2618316 RepID=UPI003983246E